MAYEEKKYKYDNHFDFALRECDKKEIYISEVPSEENRKKGYRCLGANCCNQSSKYGYNLMVYQGRIGSKRYAQYPHCLWSVYYVLKFTNVY